MPGNLSFEDLKTRVRTGEIDTVLAVMVDMQGRLMGKRFQAEFFLESGAEETHSCNYLLSTDMEMETVEGYAATSWEKGYGDYAMRPDMTTLRTVPWLEGTALVICDVQDHHRTDIPHSPRGVLKRQIARLDDMGMKAMMASELEFYLFKESYEEAQALGYRDLETYGSYNEDYHIFQTTKEEGIMRAIRTGLQAAGVPVENTKGEADAGQGEVNVRYSDALDMADNHVFIKNACKEIAWLQGRALTFMAKWNFDKAGNSCHVHQSLWSKSGEALFFDKNGKYGMSEMMRQYVAGLLNHADEITYFLAPYINSYKRFQEGTFAPTKAIWSLDNRTAGYRLCGADTKGIRIECRVGGADLTPHLAYSAMLAAGLDGIERKLDLEEEFTGDAYLAQQARGIPTTLREAIEKLDKSKMLRDALGDDVVDHYVHAGSWEQTEYDRRVTDWEVSRGFERA